MCVRWNVPIFIIKDIILINRFYYGGEGSYYTVSGFLFKITIVLIRSNYIFMITTAKYTKQSREIEIILERDEKE